MGARNIGILRCRDIGMLDIEISKESLKKVNKSQRKSHNKSFKIILNKIPRKNLHENPSN